MEASGEIKGGGTTLESMFRSSWVQRCYTFRNEIYFLLGDELRITGKITWKVRKRNERITNSFSVTLDR